MLAECVLAQVRKDGGADPEIEATLRRYHEKPLEALAAIDGIPPKLISRVGKQLTDAVVAAKADQSDYQPPSPPDEEQKILLKEMQSQVAECAKNLDIAAETVASKRELSGVIVTGNTDTRVFNGWRRDLIGEQLLGLL